MGIAKCAIAPALAIWPTAGGPPGQNVDFPLRLVIALAIGPTRLAPKHFSSRIILLLEKENNLGIWANHHHEVFVRGPASAVQIKKAIFLTDLPGI